jgi:predicted RecA/RadA family phage recombinase
MKAIRVHSADNIDYTPPADLAAGSVVVQGTLIGIATRQLLAGRIESLAIQGVFDVEKAAGAVTAGQVIYWDSVAQLATTTVGSNTLMGKAVRGALGGDTRVRVLLTP